MASKQGASKVLAIEASGDMVNLAKLNVERNGEKGKITIIHDLSSNVQLAEEDKAEAIVSETLGALMLGEGMLDYLVDARRRLCRPGAAVIPAGGAQYATLGRRISSPSLAMVSSVNSQCCKGFDLSAIGSLQDTGNLFFTKQWGFRLNSLPAVERLVHVRNMPGRVCPVAPGPPSPLDLGAAWTTVAPDLVEMSERVSILEVDFGHTERAHIPATKTFRLQALHDGIVHAVVASWEVWAANKAHRITTHHEDTKHEPWGFARDMQWGQGLQLVEDFDAAGRSERNAAPASFVVKAGEALLLSVRFSVPCRQTFQFTLRREGSKEA
ncbi:unnamed protein product [Prorocentrum cordatum]|uniref:tRNA(Phe) (4-demethylwyosine(37)-C(7)) aminocarboxypropyltransferase n=1 Tax=Prorocentrum cordatum TaxID=2364126 RepID=A0ABN9SND5_9DINO|nr:unnamed protein product [Polarella glacialis]